MRLQFREEEERLTPSPGADMSTFFTSPSPKSSLYSYSGMPVAMATGRQRLFEYGM